jgi:hypothetical protein
VGACFENAEELSDFNEADRSGLRHTQSFLLADSQQPTQFMLVSELMGS